MWSTLGKSLWATVLACPEQFHFMPRHLAAHQKFDMAMTSQTEKKPFLLPVFPEQQNKSVLMLLEAVCSKMWRCSQCILREQDIQLSHQLRNLSRVFLTIWRQTGNSNKLLAALCQKPQRNVQKCMWMKDRGKDSGLFSLVFFFKSLST